jgi:uncharacterized protein (DUF1684 family)
MNRLVTMLKPGIVSFLVFCFFSSYSQSDDAAIADIQAHRKKQSVTFKDPHETPLSPRDRRKFKGLNYFPIDLKYRVEAKFVRHENPVFFKMKTTTARLPDYVKYGEVQFLIDGRSYQLEVYQSPDIIKRPGYEDYLFIPFTDLTNGYATYDVGRYLEMRIPESDSVIIDFNKAYNPYCSYSPNYSCPIPPEANHLPIEIPAGEKKYKEVKH